MRLNPRIGQAVCLILAALAACWLATDWLADQFLAQKMGMARHALTYLALIVLFSALVVAVMFRNLARLRENLQAGYGVIAAWRIDEPAWTAVAQRAVADEQREKRIVLRTVWICIALIFTAFALLDQKAAPVMLGIGFLLLLVMGVAYLAGMWLSGRRSTFAGGTVVIGYKGLLMNGVLHCWDNWRARLVSVSLNRLEKPAQLHIIYRQRMRSTEEEVRLLVPVGPDDLAAATKVVVSLMQEHRK